jgi:hypothetical protein
VKVVGKTGSRAMLGMDDLLSDKRKGRSASGLFLSYSLLSEYQVQLQNRPNIPELDGG